MCCVLQGAERVFPSSTSNSASGKHQKHAGQQLLAAKESQQQQAAAGGGPLDAHDLPLESLWAAGLDDGMGFPQRCSYANQRSANAVGNHIAHIAAASTPDDERVWVERNASYRTLSGNMGLDNSPSDEIWTLTNDRKFMRTSTTSTGIGSSLNLRDDNNRSLESRDCDFYSTDLEDSQSKEIENYRRYYPNSSRFNAVKSLQTITRQPRPNHDWVRTEKITRYDKHRTISQSPRRDMLPEIWMSKLNEADIMSGFATQRSSNYKCRHQTRRSFSTSIVADLAVTPDGSQQSLGSTDFQVPVEKRLKNQINSLMDAEIFQELDKPNLQSQFSVDCTEKRLRDYSFELKNPGSCPSQIYATKVMPLLGKFFLILTLFYIQVKAHQIPGFTNFEKKQSVNDLGILIALIYGGAVTENQSFVYATCDDQTSSFKQNNCTVNIETPAFYNATYKDTCLVNFTSEKPDQEFFGLMFLYALGDDKVLISWLVKDSDFKTKRSKVRIIRMDTCKHQDVTLPSEESHNIIPNGNNFDFIVKNKTYCGSGDLCRLSFDSDGNKLAGPVPFLSNIEASYVSIALPVDPRQANKEIFILAMNELSMNNSKILHVNAEGKGTDLLTFKNPKMIRMSNSHEAMTVCYSTEQTNITCQLYDLKMSPKLTVFFEFPDKPVGQDTTVRWLQPHNLQDGGFLLVTGATDPKSQKLESFSVIKVNPNGQKERPLVIDGLDFECSWLQTLFISVSENYDDEICFHFICQKRVDKENGELYSLKFSAKCMPKKFMSLAKNRTSSIN